MTSKKNEYQVNHQTAKGVEDYFESWDAGGESSYLYTEDRGIAQMLKEQFPRCATYIFRGALVAWQFTVPTRLIPLLKRRCRTEKVFERKKARISAVDSQRLTVSEGLEFRIAETN